MRRLREIAEAATPGPWDYNLTAFVAAVDAQDPDNEFRFRPLLERNNFASEADYRHIATFDPPTVLALLDVAEAAEDARYDGQDERQRLRDALARLREVSDVV